MGVAAVIGFRLMIPDIKAWFSQRRTEKAVSEAPASPISASTTVDYIEAGAIIEGYIEPQTSAMPDSTRLSVRRDFLDRFDKVTGAKLGEYEYNRALLHQWMQSNAARFLVEKRHEMQ